MNGAATVLRLVTESEPVPAPDKPAACQRNGHSVDKAVLNGHIAPAAATGIAAPTPPISEIEAEIGNLLVQAAGLICVGAEKRLRGEDTLTTTSLQTGELIARLFELQQRTPGFAAIAAREGRRALRAALPPAAARHPDLESTLNEVLSWPLSVLARVTESERAFAN